MKEEKLRKFEQVRDVLEYGKFLHEEMKALAERIEDQEQSKRLKLLLDYLKRHEDELARSLAKFEEETQAHILNLWLPYPPTPELEKKLRNLKIHPHMSVEEIAKLVFDFEDALIELYKQALSEIDDVHVQEVLQNLVQLEDAEKRRFAMNLARLEGI
ncbi:hypothetical protein MIN45_P2199 [Methylomarinovum tepidoasis]|uniref:ATPase n=1 Tax=Methylomarinovum tepidoasis TaxID=2840183 RepID=A0AAU9CK51_9GAMM|nr:hypothetical protein [Methylomarinovum sp. IN45]BCX89826.1 hypothetical protein MIN45_P2199 [Methylomarinovum sp. IN45]